MSKIVYKPFWMDAKKSLPQVSYTRLLLLENSAISTGYLSKRKPNPIWTIHDPDKQDQKVICWMNIDSII